MSDAGPVQMPRRLLDAITRVIGARSAGSSTPASQSSDSTRYAFERMRIHVVCYEGLDDWILGKIATNLQRELTAQGMAVTLGHAADPSAEINHHVVYFDYEERAPTIETVMITHINDERELGKIERQLIDLDVEMGICMSFEAVHRLAHFDIPRSKLCYISPAQEQPMRPRPTVIGLTTRLYPDGCKREHLLEELTRAIRPEDFSFVIMGARWEAVVDRMRQRGFAVRYLDQFDASLYRELMPTFDYYLYLGQDEGSIGFLDALAAGVATIVTPQGFHLDVPGGVTHAVETLDDLCRVFVDIAAIKRARVDSVAHLTWPLNARRHVAIWEYLRRFKGGREVPPELWVELGELAVVPGRARPRHSSTQNE